MERCFERRERPTRFVPSNNPPVWVRPHWGSDVRAYAGINRPELKMTSDNYDVPAKECQDWELAVIEQAANKNGFLLAKLIGRAGKYRFWRLAHGSASEAMEAGRIHKEEVDSQNLKEEDRMEFGWATALEPNEFLFIRSESGEEKILDLAVKYRLGRVSPWHWEAKVAMWFESSGSAHRVPAGTLFVMDDNGERGARIG